MAENSSRWSALPPEEILQSLLASHCIGISLEQSAEVCATIGVPTETDIDTVARRLEEEISKRGFKLKHTHAVEVLSQISAQGFSTHVPNRPAEIGHIYLTSHAIEGEDVGDATYSSIGGAVSAAIAAVERLIPMREPALCNLTKLPSGFNLDVRQASSPWFEFLVLGCRADSAATRSEFEPVWLDDDELRAAFRRLVDGIETVRPTVLVNGGAVPKTEEPWCKAWFQITSTENGTEYAIVDEKDLFNILDSCECYSIENDKQTVILTGKRSSFFLKIAWQNIIPKGQERTYIDNTKESIFEIWNRFFRYRKSLSQIRVSTALSLITETTDSLWTVQVDALAMHALLEERDLNARRLSQMAGVRYRDIRALEDNPFVSPDWVLHLASALRVSPEKLLEKQPHLTPFPVLHAAIFLSAVSGANHILVSVSNSLPSEKRQQATLFLSRGCDIAARALRISMKPGQPKPEPHDAAERERSAVEELLLVAMNGKIMFVVMPEIRFEQFRTPRSCYKYHKTLYIQAAPLDERLRDLLD